MENLNESKSNVGQPIDRKANLKLIGDILVTNKAKAGKGNPKSAMNTNQSLKAKVNNTKMNIRKAQ